MKRLLCLLGLSALSFSPLFATTLPPCLGGVTVSTFRLLLEPEGKGAALPLSSVNVIREEEKLKYEPVHIPPAIKDKAQIAILLVPAKEDKATQENAADKAAGKSTDNSTGKSNSNTKSLIMLEARPAKSPTEWVIPARASIVGVVFGPHGLDVKKVSSMVEKNEDLIPQLADYAQQTATVEALVQMLSQIEESPTPGQDVNAALRGFSTEYGVALPKLDPTAPTNQQAALLLQAVLPSAATYDPINANRSAVVAQSVGLASSVAALFFGTPVALAAGGAVLFENLRIMMFPDTDFHAAFTQPAANTGMALCTKDLKVKPRTRPAYLWMLRVPDAAAPKVSLPKTVCLPLGSKSAIKVASTNSSELKLLPRAREWQLVSSTQSAEVAATVTVGTSDDMLELDLSHSKLPAGAYQLAAKWDWDPVEVAGSVDLRPFGDFSRAKVSDDSEDRLVEGSGPVKIELTGADFEFVNKVVIAKTAEDTPREISITTPPEASGKDHTSLEMEIDTSALHAGSYLLKLTQSDGSTHELPLVIHPPNPVLSSVPLRVNVGEPQQIVTLQGSGLERIDGVYSEGATWILAPPAADAHNVRERKATVTLLAQAKKGDLLDLSLKVSGLHSPLKILGVLQVAGPRPKITGANESASQATSVALRQGEIAAEAPVSFAIQTENAGPYPLLILSCANASDVKRSLTLHAGDRNEFAQLDFAGEDVLFLSLNPGSVGYSGCQLQATVTVEETGASDPYPLGRVIRLPSIDTFLLSDEKESGDLYLGALTGQQLQAIEKTGWDPKHGWPVAGIPTPVSGNPQEQRLSIKLSWPPPSPRAPLYVWLRGETAGRLTQAKYQ